MSKYIELKYNVDLDDEALEIIVRRRPALKGKTLEESRAILRAEFTSKRQDEKAPKAHR